MHHLLVLQISIPTWLVAMVSVPLVFAMWQIALASGASASWPTEATGLVTSPCASSAPHQSQLLYQLAGLASPLLTLQLPQMRRRQLSYGASTAEATTPASHILGSALALRMPVLLMFVILSLTQHRNPGLTTLTTLKTTIHCWMCLSWMMPFHHSHGLGLTCWT